MQTNTYGPVRRGYAGQKRTAFVSVIPLAALFAVFIISLWFRTTQPGIIPMKAMSNMWTAIRLGTAELFHQPMALDKYDIIREHDCYYETISRFRNSLVTLISGAAVCTGGTVFQTMFKNPLASPNILGISTGVNLGTILFLYMFPYTAMAMLQRRYLFCFVSAGILVGFTMIAGKIAGRRTGRFSVADMLVTGAIISQFGGILTMYFQFKLEEIDPTLLTAYQEINMGLYVLTDFRSLIIFITLMAVSMFPVYLIRYRLNATVLDDQDARSIGVNVDLLRGVGMFCGAIMAITALVECGDLGIVSMAVPPVIRYICKGADIRKVLYYSICVGGMVLLAARGICSMIYVAGMSLPINFAISLLVLPMFVLAMSKQRSDFE